MPAYRFGEFQLDLDARQLRRSGEPVRLERRPFDLLALLVAEPERLHTRQDIIAALWPGKSIIDFDAGLNTLVRKVRHALDDSSEHPRYIERVPGVGYRFIAPVSAAEAADPVSLTDMTAASRIAERRSPHRLYLAVALLVLVIALVAVYALRVHEPSGPDSTRIAVLPFENLTGDADLSYWASGLAEETSLSLSRMELPNLAVIGGASARALVEAGLPLREIGKQFDIDYVVDSSLRVDGSRIRVSSRLARTADGEQLWSESFDRELTDVLGLQRDLSIAIAEQIRQRLSPEIAARIDSRQTRNPEAYAYYLKGREAWTQFRPTLVEDAIAWYDKAVALDPEYGLAWAGIAHAAATAVLTTDLSPEYTWPLARQALEKALQFGPDLAETHVAEAMYVGIVEKDFVAGEVAARRAVELDPDNAMAYMTLAMRLANQGKTVESRAAMRRARELDPLFPLIYANSGYIERNAGNLEGALEYTRQAVAIDPEFWPAYFQLGFARAANKDFEGALEAFENAARYSENNPNNVARVVYLLACLGREDEARSLHDQLLARAVERYVPRYALAVAEAAVGNADSAFELLNKAVDARALDPFGFGPDGIAGREDPLLKWVTEPCDPQDGVLP